MGNLYKELSKLKHPNSRKTKLLGKKAIRMNNKQKSRLGHAVKSNIIGEKLSWFLNKLDADRKEPLTPDEFQSLIEEYLKRYDEEMEQINIKQSIGKRSQHRQHIARENAIKFTLERETNEFNGGGMELLNLCDIEKMKSLLLWDGNAINIQHFKMDLISKGFLQRLRLANNVQPKIIVTPSSSDETML